MTDENTCNEKFVRWQGIRIQHLSYVINLFLTFALASIGFILHLLTSVDSNLALCQLYLYRIALFFYFFSGLLGVICTINRLKDFRTTAQIANPNRDDRNKDKERSYAKFLGETIWTLFYAQLGLFGIGVVLLFVAVFLE